MEQEINLEKVIKRLNLGAEFVTPEPTKECCYNCDWLTFNATNHSDRWYCQYHGKDIINTDLTTCPDFTKEDF